VTNRLSPISEILHTDFLSFHPDDPVETAMRALVDRNVDAAPVTDADGLLVGMLSNTDLIVQETKLHFPTLLYFLGASVELGKKRFEEELSEALASKVGDVMAVDPVSAEESDTIEDVASLMHDHDIAHVPVVRDGRVVGLVSRNDILRAILSSD
jgi:CBS domain-containing protein